nr:hypothetical protein [Pandoravirus massiliensis]
MTYERTGPVDTAGRLRASLAGARARCAFLPTTRSWPSWLWARSVVAKKLTARFPLQRRTAPRCRSLFCLFWGKKRRRHGPFPRRSNNAFTTSFASGVFCVGLPLMCRGAERWPAHFFPPLMLSRSCVGRKRTKEMSQRDREAPTHIFFASEVFFALALCLFSFPPKKLCSRCCCRAGHLLVAKGASLFSLFSFLFFKRPLRRSAIKRFIVPTQTRKK